jgi:hypothetical protein
LLLCRPLQLSANILIFTKQPKPERFPLGYVRATQHRLIDPQVAVIETIFKCPASDIEVANPEWTRTEVNRLTWI